MKKTLFRIVFYALLFGFSTFVNAQIIKKKYTIEDVDKAKLLELQKEFGNHKIIIKEYESQILVALSHYPELKETEIEFRLKKTKTPLASRPSVGSLFFAASKRKYIVTISTKTIDYLEPILLENLSYNAQIGVLGHEVAHIAQYLNMGFGKTIHLVGIEVFSKKKVDTFERNTDIRCINHGLGYQLLAWSTEVREALKTDRLSGDTSAKPIVERERYLDPEAITARIKKSAMYN